MASPTGPVVEPGTAGAELQYRMTVEMSQAQYASLVGTTDGLFELPATITPSEFANPLRVTFSCQPPWVPYP